MRYSDDLVEEIRMKNDIVDVISGYVKLTRRGSSYFGLCPFHNEKSPSFSVSPGKQMYYCFGCGAGGNVFTFLMEYENFTFVEALKFLADRAGVELPQMEYSKEAKEQADLKNTLLEINKQAAKFYYYQLHTERGKQGYDYLKGRGLSDDTIRKFGLGYSDKYGSLLYRFLKEKGYCLGMPVKKYKGENKDVVHPLNTEFRNKLTNAVIEKLKEGDKNEK
ncbi:CHC2 zinc finger domain-containing protein [uncultured Fusobacterium sp.]|uniref:CHC2 zinc finger domain-containing protein n=1 Tax=uncultured Fusobacterium sp. TaxID=159267 RepID=UPI0025E66601|nr:CHC2 zinc finger domain-containing protein [uncultured Fusobacterium sp.]